MPSAAAELLALLAPPVCVACRGPVPAAEALVCPRCLQTLPWLPRRCCPRCALPSHLGRRCRATRASYSTAAAAMAYAGPARDLVHALKFRGALPLADLLAAQMVRRLDAPGALVPVPAAPGRRRRRGYDQAERLAAALAARTGRPLARSLRRTGGARQVGAARRDRLAAGRVSLAVVGEVPRQVVLIDDVHTTGATLEACAGALRAAGAEEVAALTYARTL